MSLVDGQGDSKRSETARLLPLSADLIRSELALDGVSLRSLAEEFGTPLYVYDERTLRVRARSIRAAFEPLRARVSFAAKACSTIGVLRIFREEGLGLDVVSEGELRAGLRAGFSPSDIHLHGNFKSDGELNLAVETGVHAVVLDNLEEIERLEELCSRAARTTRVMLRLALPLEAETHPHLQTSGRGSKFGVLRASQEEAKAYELLKRSRCLSLMGVHVHLGSQIRDADIYRRAARELVNVSVELRNRGFKPCEVSVGGGWAVPYAPGDEELQSQGVAEALATAFEGHPWLRPAIEPGRSLVARAGMAIYRIGSVKRFGTSRIVSVDGGMGDNPRPALYGARYHALMVKDPFAPAVGAADVVGRYCESGDILVRQVALPEVAGGELIAIPMSGAYQLSMASGYNLVPQPAVVMVSDGRARLLTRRATVEDLLARDLG